MQKYFDFDLRSCLEHETQWNLWQTGASLYFGNVLLFKIWEVPFVATGITQPFRNTMNRYKLKLDGTWNDVNLTNSSILEIYFPLLNVNLSQEVDNNDSQLLAQVEPNMPTIAKLLALSVDHIDLLLEDWYPSLGTRFVHTSEGRFLITRLVLCPKCLRKLMNNGNGNGKDAGDNSNDARNNDGAIGYTKNRSSMKRSLIHLDAGKDNALNVFSAYLNATRRERRSEVCKLHFVNISFNLFILVAGFAVPFGCRFWCWA